MMMMFTWINHTKINVNNPPNGAGKKFWNNNNKSRKNDLIMVLQEETIQGT
jgi:hypothetical protein